jgi:hypothetical protein
MKTKDRLAQGTMAKMGSCTYIENIFLLLGQFIADILVEIRGKGGPRPRLVHALRL